MYKKCFGMFIVGLMIIQICSCANRSENSVDLEMTTITVAVRSGEKSNWEKVTEVFEKENSDIRLKFVELGSDFEQYRLLESALSSKECAFDVMEIENVWLEEFKQNGYLMPLETGVWRPDKCIDKAAESFESDGISYAVPFQADIGLILVSKEYEWDENLWSIKTGGILSDTPDNVYEKADITGVLTELTAYTQGDTVAALELYKNIYGNSFGEDESVKRFGDGGLPIVRSWSSNLIKFRNNAYNASGNFRVYNMPLNENGEEITTAKFFGMAVSSLTKNSEKCMRFLKYCVSQEFQRRWIESIGTYPVCKNLYNDASINSEWNHILPMADRIENVNTVPRMSKYAERAHELQKVVLKYVRGEECIENAAGKLNSFLQIQ